MIFHLDIPSSGAVTLAVRLASAFLPVQTRIFDNALHFPEDVERLWSLASERKFVSSRVDGPLFSKINDLDLIITVRDPAEQILSYWRDLLRDPKHEMHSAAAKLRHRVFFSRFGDYYTNFQSTYFVGAFIDTSTEVQRFGHYATLTKRLLECLDRVHWVVPTEKVDEFIGLWSLETKRWVPNGLQRTIVSESFPDSRGETLAEVREYLQKRTDLYALDLLFYNMAQERFAAYRSNILRSQGIERYAGNSRQAFVSGESAIWLSDNWYDPVPIEGGHAWWAGPTVKSVVHVRRASDEKYLTFDIIVISGIAYESIVVLDKTMVRKLSTRRVRSDSHCKFCVTLEGLAREDDVVVLVPNCKAAIITTIDSDGLDRQSFAATNWSLGNDLVV